jgi:hypothetical protein
MKISIPFLLLVAAGASCKNNGETRPDISQIKAEVAIQRFDRDFFSIDTLETGASLNKLLQQQPAFTANYLDYYTPIGQLARAGNNRDEVLKKYIHDIKPLYDSVSEKFKNVSWLEKELSLAFRYAKHYFPDFKTPAVYTTVEGLSPDDPEEIYGAIYYRDTLSISLQMYAGMDFSGYDPKRYYDYLRRRFEPTYITRNAIRAVILARYPEKPALTLLHQMIEAGRRLYIMDKILPDMPGEIKLGYTKEQYKDCQDREKLIWSHFLNNQLLYSEEPAINREYIGENPFTKELGDDSPGNIGAITGWQIVKKFMKGNKGLTMDQLMNTDPAEIFSEAHYKPD